MLKPGALILSVWCWLNVLPAVASLVSIASGKHAPGLSMRFAPEEIPAIESRALAMVDGLATLLNALIAVYCITCFVVVRKSLLKAERWSLVTFAIGALIIQVACYASDRLFFLSKNALVIHASSLVLLTGFILCVMGIQKKPNPESPVSP